MTDAIEIELAAAAGFAARQQFQDSFRNLERAHILSQSSTWQHVRVHYRMLRWAVQRKDSIEPASRRRARSWRKSDAQ